MSNKGKGRLLRAVALLIDVGVPLGVTAAHFPVWVERSAEATLSGMFLFFAIISAIPLIKVFFKTLKTPAAWMIWTIMFVALASLRVIINEMVVISLCGMCANIVGAVLHKIGGALARKE